MHTSFRRDVEHALSRPETAALVTEDDLGPLPPCVQNYLRTAGVVGHPRVMNMHARMHGRIRSGVGASWMPFVAEQYSFFHEPARYFYMKASKLLIPIHVYHRYAGSAASMQVKVVDLVPVASASGPAMTKAETVTMFNDMCLLAPATLINPGIQWQPMDDHRTLVTFTNAGHTILAELSFNASGQLVDFTSGDRLRIESNGSMTATPWSTPMSHPRAFGPFQLASRGQAIWHASDGSFAYVELDIDEVAYNVP